MAHRVLGFYFVAVLFLQLLLLLWTTSATASKGSSSNSNNAKTKATAASAGSKPPPGARSEKLLDYDAFMAFAAQHNSQHTGRDMVVDPIENLKLENSRYCAAIIDQIVSAPAKVTELINAYKQQIKLLINVFTNSKDSGRVVDLSPILSDSIYYGQLCLFRLMKHSLKLKPNSMVTKAAIEEGSFSWVFMITQELMKMKALQLDDPDSLGHITIDIDRKSGRDARDLLSSATLYRINSIIPVIRAFMDTEMEARGLITLSSSSSAINEDLKADEVSSSSVQVSGDASFVSEAKPRVFFHPSICDALGNKDAATLFLLLSGSPFSSSSNNKDSDIYSSLSGLIRQIEFNSSFATTTDNSNFRVNICKQIFEKIKTHEEANNIIITKSIPNSHKPSENIIDDNDRFSIKNLLSISSTVPVGNSFCKSEYPGSDEKSIFPSIKGHGESDTATGSDNSDYLDGVDLGYDSTTIRIVDTSVDSSTSNSNSNSDSKEKKSIPRCSVLRMPLSAVTRSCLVHSLTAGQPMLIHLDKMDDLLSSGIKIDDWSIDSLSSIKERKVTAGEIPYSSLFGMKEKSFSFEDFSNSKNGFRQQTSKLAKLESLRRKIVHLLRDASDVGDTTSGNSNNSNSTYDVVINTNIVSLVRNKPLSTNEDGNKALVKQVLSIFIAENRDLTIGDISDNANAVTIAGLTSRYIKLLSEIIKQPRYYMFARKTISTSRSREILSKKEESSATDTYLQGFLDKFDIEKQLINSKFWDLVTWLSGDKITSGNSSKSSSDEDDTDTAAVAALTTHLQMYLGGPLSGAAFHSHGPALNLLVAGKKRWRLQAPYPASHYSNIHPLDYLEAPIGDCELTQRGGEILFVPKFFSHEVLNLAESVGFALEIQDYI